MCTLELVVSTSLMKYTRYWILSLVSDFPSSTMIAALTTLLVADM
jgi:hypothetical protein